MYIQNIYLYLCIYMLYLSLYLHLYLFIFIFIRINIFMYADKLLRSSCNISSTSGSTDFKCIYFPKQTNIYIDRLSRQLRNTIPEQGTGENATPPLLQRSVCRTIRELQTMQIGNLSRVDGHNLSGFGGPCIYTE